jgi:Holliday junction resolvase RusA-like endonuclease
MENNYSPFVKMDNPDAYTQGLLLELKGIPFAKQSFRYQAFVPKGKKFAIVHKYQPKKVIEGENTLRAQIISELPAGFEPFTKAVVVRAIKFIFPLPKSAKKKTLDLVNRGMIVYKISKPDLTDNLMKGLFDAMKGIVFQDDSQVALICNVSKIYGKVPGIQILLDEIETELS